MIYTVTFNPSLDYVVQLPAFKDGGVNRVSSERIFAGGKGNNAAVILSRLGVPCRALGFKAGFTGEAMEQMLRGHGCDTDFISLKEGMTRINVKVKAEGEFEINGQGPSVSEEDIQRLYEKTDVLESGDILVLSGSIPASLPDDMYERIMKRLFGKGVRICVDAVGDLLLKTLQYRPFLVKPNRQELGELFGLVLESEEQMIRYAQRLQEMGACNLLVSMAGDGAILADETGGVHRMAPPEGTVVNSVGAGDSMVAGFLAGYVRSGSYEEALTLGTAAGSATAFTSWLAGREEIEEMRERLKRREESV